MMKKYRYEFKEYNVVRNNLNSEELTLDNIKTGFLEGKPTKEEKRLLKDPQEWANYAFKENKEYYVTAFDIDEPIACINFSPISIRVNFLERDNISKKLINYMSMVYFRLKSVDLGLGKFKMVPYEKPEVFLKQIERYEDTEDKKITSRILFHLERENDINGNMVIKKSEIIRKPTFSGSNTEEETTVNLSNNWIEPPSHYLDFDRFLDFESIMKSEYLDLSEDN